MKRRHSLRSSNESRIINGTRRASIMRSGTITVPRHFHATDPDHSCGSSVRRYNEHRMGRSEIFALSQMVNPADRLAETSGVISSTTVRLQSLGQMPGPSRPTMGANPNRYINGL